MKRTLPDDLPRMRKEKLVIDNLLDEVLVYDLDRHQAHCLNQTAALVWRACDGRTNVDTISRRVTRKLDTAFDEDLVWLALRQLENLHLLEKSISPPPQFLGLTRRQMIRRLGLAAAFVVPVVTSIVAPTPAEASTCSGTGQPCNGGVSCCPGHFCQGNNICT